jgi:hypothetical protein
MGSFAFFLVRKPPFFHPSLGRARGYRGAGRVKATQEKSIGRRLRMCECTSGPQRAALDPSEHRYTLDEPGEGGRAGSGTFLSRLGLDEFHRPTRGR